MTDSRPIAAEDAGVPWHLSLEVRLALNHKPLPFVHFGAGYGIVWSAKSASTMVLLWHLAQLGRLDASLGYGDMPHKYRQEVLQLSPDYLDWLQDGDPSRITWYWIVRDPVARALSSFRHYVRRRKNHRAMTGVLGRDMAEGCSLDDFMEFLERVDVGSPCDVHIRSQLHPLLELCPFRMVNADRQDLAAELNAIAAAHGLGVTDFAALAEIERMAGIHHARQGGMRRTVDSRTRLTLAGAKHDWPMRLDCLEDASRRRLERIYAADMARIYGPK